MAGTNGIMARNFKELEAKMDPERRARVEKRVQEILKAIPAVPDSMNESTQPSSLPSGRERE
jgi:hypothetical protein